MGIGRHLRKLIAACMAACLAVGMLPAGALAEAGSFVDGIGADSSGAQQMERFEGGQASSNVYVEVARDAFELVGRSPDHAASDGAAAIAFYGARIWAQTQGGASPISGTWTVTCDGAPAGTYPATQRPDGTWGLDLSADGASGSLQVATGHEYACAFEAQDAQGRRVAALVTFLTVPGSPYGAKTIYPAHEETFDGVATYAEPSATGLIHKQVQHLAATECAPLSPTYSSLMELAAAYAREHGLSGAYEIASAWSLEARFTMAMPDPQPLAYKGALGVVIPIKGAASDEPSAGSEVMVFSFDGEGAKEARACTVRVDSAGNKYVAFDDATLGAYAVGIYRAGGDGSGDGDDGDDVVRVIGEARGDGFVNYEGAYTWPKAGAVRYLFTPVVPGSELASVEVSIDGAPVQVPSWAVIAGYYDLDLASLGPDVREVRIVGTFESTGRPIDPDKPVDPTDPDSPDNPANKHHTLTVQVQGEGSVAVTVNRFESAPPHRFDAGDAIQLACAPSGASAGVESAMLVVDGMPGEIPLAVIDGSCTFTAPDADALVRVVFSSKDAPAELPFEVTVIIEGGHGSIDAPYGSAASAVSRASKRQTASRPATFTLFPERGWRLYTAMEGDVEVGAYLTQASGAYGLSVPYAGRDRTIVVRFTEQEELPPVVKPDTFATVDVQVVAEDGLDASSLPEATPSQVAVPKGASYSFYLIPAPSADAELSSVRMKRAGQLTWVDITGNASWVAWPAGADAGYWLLTLSGIEQDTHVRAAFRPIADGEPARPPAKTRNITINVIGGEYGAVFPNTVGKPPLKVPAGKTITVTVVTKDGYKYEVRKADDARVGEPMGSGDIALLAPLQDATQGEGESTSTEVIGGAGDADEDWEFVFGPEGGDGPGGDGPGGDGPGGDGPGGDGPGGDGPGGDGDNNGDGNGSGDNNGGTGDADISGTGRFTVTCIVVPDSSGRSHGYVSPASPVSVVRGGAVSFTFVREVGYRVAYVEVNGKRASGYTDSGYQLRDVQADTVVKVAFTARAETDAMGSVERTVHRLTSLAKTGDLNAAALTLLAAIAFASAGAAVLAAARRRREEASE